MLGLEDVNSNFNGLCASFADAKAAAIWRQIVELDDPVGIELPDNFESKLSNFQKLMVFKVLREEKLVLAVKNYVLNTLGQEYIESPAFDLKGSFQDSTCTTPIIFILSPGADPMSSLLNLAKEKEMDGPRFKILSLGQGQGDIAAEYIKSGRRNGDWVCLQNCHLAATWMTEFERIQEKQVEAETHGEFRLWLTSMPTQKFPVPVLQSGIKLTNEPPKGLKANLRRTFNEVDEKFYESSQKPAEFKKLLFSLAFFHATILERRKFGAIGWNIPYEWMNSDFETCLRQLKIYLDEPGAIPYVTLRFLISEINYGGRVTDDKDVRLITSLLMKYFNSDVIGDTYKFSVSGVYYAPAEGNINSVKDYITSLPLEDDPEVFGLHPNANITFQQKTVREFMETLIIMNPKSSEKGGSSGSSKDPVSILAEEIENQINAVFGKEGIVLEKQKEMTSLDVFRAQEIDRMIKLVKIIQKSLTSLQKAILGLQVISIQIERMQKSFMNSKVPDLWADNAYPSLKPLGAWVRDLCARIKFMKEWCQGPRDSYWISAFFFPQGFMTSVLQTYARKTRIAIDTLRFRTEVRDFDETDIKVVPENGCNIHGIFIQGCRWDIGKGVLAESEKNVLETKLPCIWLEPVTNDKYDNKGTYLAPLYKTSERRGTLSTTGHSTNFVLYFDLKTDIDPAHWVRRGVALLCQLDEL